MEFPGNEDYRQKSLLRVKYHVSVYVCLVEKFVNVGTENQVFCVTLLVNRSTGR